MPDRKAELVSKLVEDQEAAREESLRRQALSPEDRRREDQLDRTSRRAFGGTSGTLVRKQESAKMKEQASKDMEKMKVARGQVKLVGDTPEDPDRQ